MTEFGGWEQIKPLGEGGQSRVFLVRNPSRVQMRNEAIKKVLSSNPWEQPYARLDALTAHEPTQQVDRLAKSLWEYMRPDDPSELGALKIFKIPPIEPDAERAIGRLKNEIELLGGKRPGLVKLLKANEQEKWIVTEFMFGGTLEDHLDIFKGDAVAALKAFKSVVEAAAYLHEEKIVHRDIKPANVFIGKEDNLVLGDMGIAYLPNQDNRITTTNERVGPRDYMPEWGNLGVRLEDVRPSFDVYMLGKFLWCMIAGRLRLPREWHKNEGLNLETIFPNNRHMKNVNSILDKCLVDKEDRCLPSAKELLEIVDSTLNLFERGLTMLDQSGQLICQICGRGTYRTAIKGHTIMPTYNEHNVNIGSNNIQLFSCDVCHHYELFELGYPDKVIKKGWKP
jgi:serine/threonine protein kinase